VPWPFLAVPTTSVDVREQGYIDGAGFARDRGSLALSRRKRDTGGLNLVKSQRD